MKTRLWIAALALMSLPLLAHASCDTVKSEIAARMKAKGMSNFSLGVATADHVGKGASVVGQCEGDKAIVFTRGQAKASDGALRSAPRDYPAVNVHHAG